MYFQDLFQKFVLFFSSASANIWREYPPVCGTAVQHPLIWSGHFPSSERLLQHGARHTSPSQLWYQLHCPTCVKETGYRWSYPKNTSIEDWSRSDPSHFTQADSDTSRLSLCWETADNGATKEEMHPLQERLAHLNVKNTLWQLTVLMNLKRVTGY